MQQVINMLRYSSTICLLMILLSSFSNCKANHQVSSDVNVNRSDSICDTLLIYDFYVFRTARTYIGKNSLFNPDKMEILKGKIQGIIENSQYTVIIEYHTDVRGTESSNMQFSINVLNELQQELSSDFNESDMQKILFIPMGETNPLISENELKKIKDVTEKDRIAQKNRRFTVYCK